MAFNTSELIAYARSIADLQNTKFISETDELVLINEAYRDIYSRYTESDGDYYTKEAVITLDSTMLDPNSNGKSYKIPLPTDFYKLRFVDYNYGGNWNTCNKFSTSQRNQDVSVPMYRLINNTLWILAAPGTASQIKITYYIPPQELVASQPTLVYPNYTNILYPSYIGGADQLMAYVTSGRYIILESFINQTTDIIFDYGADNVITGLIVYKNYAYFIVSDNLIKRIPIDGSANGIATTLFDAEGIATNSTCKYMSVNQLTGLIYFSFKNSTTNIDTEYSMTTAGTNLSTASNGLLYAFGKVKVYGNDQSYYINSSNELVVRLDAGVLTTIQDVIFVTMYNGSLYYVQMINDQYTMYRLSFYTDTLTFDSTEIASNIIYLGNITEEYASTLVYDSINIVNSVQATPVTLPTVLDYPTNEVNEILAYTSAIAYARKQSDTAKMGLLQARLTELWDRFWSVNKRDEYQFTRINNDYQRTTSNYWG